MDLISEFRNSKALIQLQKEMENLVTRSPSNPWRLMEVCGGQTHSILKHQLLTLLPPGVEIIHGPGCPVCITPESYIDKAYTLSFETGVQVFSFGDMMRVPGKRGSLLDARSRGGQIAIVYSPLDAVQWAQKNPETNVVFLAIGFETTVLPNTLAVLQAQRLNLKNFFLLTHQVCVPPAIEFILNDAETQIDGFLAAGHVCTITGTQAYVPISEKHLKPMVVTGFEPVDILLGVRTLLKKLELKETGVFIEYSRMVRPNGNPEALSKIQRVFKPGDQDWRGFGIIPNSGLFLHSDFECFDARRRWPLKEDSLLIQGTCPAASVMKGVIKPPECPFFNRECRPSTPLGAPMVSSEGACAAYFNYSLLNQNL